MNYEESPRSTIPARILRWIKYTIRWVANDGRGLRFLKKTSFFSGLLLLVFLLTWLAIRGWILDFAVQKAEQKLTNKGYEFAYSQKGYTGLFGVEFKDISVQMGHVPDSILGKKLFSCKHLEIGITIWRFWDIGLSRFTTQNLNFNLVNLPNNCNYCALLADDSSKKEKQKESNDPIVSLFRQFEKWIGKAPNNLRMSGTNISLTDTTGTIKIELPETSFQHQTVHLEIKALKEPIAPKDKDTIRSKPIEFLLFGNIDKDDLTGHVVIAPVKNQKFVSIPLILNGLGFEKAEFEVAELRETSGAIHADLRGGFSHFQVDDIRISDTLVKIDSAQGRFICDIKDGFIELDSQSEVRVNQITSHIFAQYKGGHNPHYAIGLHMPQISANAFFSSLPLGLFRNIGIPKATGMLEYRFQFAMDHNKPQDCLLESRMWPSKDFTIIQWGNVDPRMMNGQFTYTYWEKGKPVARFVVGPSNGNFTPYDGISPDLIGCVLRSEDPDFWHHQGFYMDAFRSSIAQNYRQKRFARGGSTISMQLVKNVFLGRRKTIARKVEEILLTWLMERRSLVSKTRMLEVYLNVIEWGPGIFGATEAAQFYFHKHPSELNLGECTFLASIIPMPKKVRWLLDSNGCVRQNQGHFNALKNRLLAKDSGSIDTAVFQVCIHPDAWSKLKGSAKKVESSENLPHNETLEGGLIHLEAIDPEND